MLIYHVSASKKVSSAIAIPTTRGIGGQATDRVSLAQAISDRFYRALYASLFDSRLSGSSKQALYLNLVFKAVKQDKEKNRVMAFVKRLVQLLLNMDVTFILGSLWIIGEVRLALCFRGAQGSPVECLADSDPPLAAQSTAACHDPRVAQDGHRTRAHLSQGSGSKRNLTRCRGGHSLVLLGRVRWKEARAIVRQRTK